MEKRQTLFFLAVILIFVGILITLENLQVIQGLTNHWPVFLLITGCGFVLLFFQKAKKDLVLLFLGTFTTILGVFFYYLNFTSWGVLSSLWPIFLGIVGLSFLSLWFYSKIPLYAYFGVFFSALFLAFSLVFTISPKLWPMTFVVIGVSLLILEHFTQKEKSQDRQCL